MWFKRLVRSFRYAFKGLAYLVSYERNFKVHVGALILVIVGGIYFNLSFIEFSLALLAAGAVLVTEAINSGMEILLDIIYPEHNGKSKIIKDLMAGAVLISALFSIAIGVLVCLNHF